MDDGKGVSSGKLVEAGAVSLSAVKDSEDTVLIGVRLSEELTSVGVGVGDIDEPSSVVVEEVKEISPEDMSDVVVEFVAKLVDSGVSVRVSFERLRSSGPYPVS